MTSLTAKMRRDPFYAKALDHYGDEKSLVQAGFFDDGLAEGAVNALADPRWMTTPLYKIRRPKGKAARPLVLFSTGGFAPVHEGHLQMMEAARAKMIREGYDVIGGFLCPAHDSYVLNKGSGAERFPVHVRLENLEKALFASDWLEIDPWMALYAPNDLNFTDVFRRLEGYLKMHVASSRPIEVAYVFGADNALFARAFLKKGNCVVVNRPGHQPNFAGVSDDKALMSTGRIHLAESNVDISSRQIRMGERVFAQMVEAEKILSDGHGADARTIFIRDDLDWALEPWREKTTPAALSKATDDFVSDLIRILKTGYADAAFLPPGQEAEILLVPAREQVRWLEKNLGNKPFINMDCVTGAAGYPAHISRLFHLSDRQHFSLGIVHRPDAIDDLANLPGGEYALVDDDIATGASMRRLEERLPERVHIVERISLLKKWFSENFPHKTYNPVNILDMRDFLVGARMGGLVVEGFNGNHGRVPYLAPYVSLHSRSSIPKERENRISAQIFELNARFFKAIGNTLLLRDADPSFKRLMLDAGFDARMPLGDLCEWHRQILAYSSEK